MCTYITVMLDCGGSAPVSLILVSYCIYLLYVELTDCVSLLQVMVRDYTDMLWSSYNFWCKREYDGDQCDFSKWANAALHRRSPALFHDLVQLDANRTAGVVQPFHYPMEKPCINAGGYFTEYLDLHLYSRNLHNHTILVASEELDAFPLHVAHRVASITGHNIEGIDLSKFQQVRVNTQEAKGTDATIAIDKYTPGRYNISQYQPVWAESRTLLGQCWREDCLRLAQLAPYYRYAACHPELQVASGGQFKQAGSLFVPA